MSKNTCLLLLCAVSTPAIMFQFHNSHSTAATVAFAQEAITSTAGTNAIPTVVIPADTPVSVPTVTIRQSPPVSIPTLVIPQPTPKPHRALPRNTKKHRTPSKPHVPTPQPVRGEWIWAYLTSYCPGSAGAVSSSGAPVFFGMLANNFYPFGTRVYIPVIGMTGIVEDREGMLGTWNHFDVWSPSCYGTPTGYFRVAIQVH